MRLIDVHAHAFSAAYVDLLEHLGAPGDVVAPARMVVAASPDADLRNRLAHMDEGNVERAILSMSAATPYLDDAESALRAARFLNDEHAARCRTHADRFSFFATLPLPHIDAALSELERAFTELSAAGVTLSTSIRGRPLSDAAFAELFAELDHRGAVVFLHPPGLACESPLIRESGLAWSLGNPIESAVCALQLMQAGFPRRYPQLRVVLPHLGGFLPFLRYRLDKAAVRSGFANEEPPSAQMRKFYYDTVSGEPEALAHAVHAYGVDRILWGSDYPYWRGDSYRHAIDYLALSGLPEADLERIRYENAAELLTAVARRAGSPQSRNLSPDPNASS
jgi:aminocarboxymuconate-semialdehyde decarboxylase